MLHLSMWPNFPNSFTIFISFVEVLSTLQEKHIKEKEKMGDEETDLVVHITPLLQHQRQPRINQSLIVILVIS